MAKPTRLMTTVMFKRLKPMSIIKSVTWEVVQNLVVWAPLLAPVEFSTGPAASTLIIHVCQS